MGRRDIGKHETKKPKKDAKKPIVMAAISPVPAPPPVEVIRKKRKQEEVEEE